MINSHEQEKKQFRRLFRQQGVDRFEERFQVLEAFLKLEHHVSLDDIVRQLVKDGVTLDERFVAQSMEQLCRFGFANRVDFDRDNTVLYEHRHLGVHHDHMVCTKCGAILEFRDEAMEAIQEKVARAYGFYMLQHKMEIYGLCAACMVGRDSLVPLNKAKPGEKLVVKAVDAGKKMQLRISSMGLKIGDTIEMVTNGIGGQVVIAAGENRLVIGTGMAEKIQVQSLGPEKLDTGVLEPVQRRAIPEGMVKLSQMKAGQEGTIARVSGESVLRRRLLEMGINRGTSVYVEKYAPLRDPLELVVKGYHISLRVEEAANILVEHVRSIKR
ncbi:MAG: FeoA domain-containing protein [Desulfobacterales bacterium]|nr:FeoA domain-containing protein [Desulfobacterales bacterium]